MTVEYIAEIIGKFVIYSMIAGFFWVWGYATAWNERQKVIDWLLTGFDIRKSK